MILFWFELIVFALRAILIARKRCNSVEEDHTMTTLRAIEPNDTALNAFLAVRAEVDTMLERLKVLSDDHFNTHPDEINWGDVGTLNHYASLLRQITDSAFKEGEHAV